MTITPSEILDHWFEGDSSVRREKWFKKEPGFDDACARFADDVRAARRGRFDHWAATPKGALALVLLLDQLSRNIFRGNAEAFAADAHALRIARNAIAAGFDKGMTACERQFLYLPFEHSESLVDQNESVRLFESLRNDLPASTFDYATRHRDVIAEFGRFPHRNAILGRRNTAAEDAYLARPDSGF